jgi:hypothetical protein
MPHGEEWKNKRVQRHKNILSVGCNVEDRIEGSAYNQTIWKLKAVTDAWQLVKITRWENCKKTGQHFRQHKEMYDNYL